MGALLIYFVSFCFLIWKKGGMIMNERTFLTALVVAMIFGLGLIGLKILAAAQHILAVIGG